MASNEQGPENFERAKYYYFWAPPIFLIIILCFFIIYLLIPGNLIYPVSASNVPDKVVISDAAKQQLIESLETQIADLENMSANAVCTDEGLMLPDNRTMLFPPKINSEIDGPTDFSILPPARKLSDPNAAEEEVSSLASLLEKTTVLIFNERSDGKTGSGTGFFISDDLILTNEHVVAEAANGTVEFTYPDSSQLHAAQIISISQPFEVNNEDYALLRANKKSENFLLFANDFNDLTLTPVVSAGFPGDVIESLLEFKMEGTSLDLDGFPVYQTNGVVNATQPYENVGALLMHSAEISQGNSGGPLVNGCGEILGMNTFTYNHKEKSVRTLNIALRADGIQDFLNRSQINYSQSEEACSPRVITKQVSE
jgi:S1-C subfamily serine protease